MTYVTISASTKSGGSITNQQFIPIKEIAPDELRSRVIDFAQKNNMPSPTSVQARIATERTTKRRGFIPPEIYSQLMAHFSKEGDDVTFDDEIELTVSEPLTDDEKQLGHKIGTAFQVMYKEHHDKVRQMEADLERLKKGV